MARYNSSLASTTITGTHTISSPNQGAFTNLSGTAPYTVTLPAPSLFPGSNQTFYNATSGTITLSTPSGILTGTGGSNASTVPCFAGNVLSVTSDGTNYVVISEDGSALVATTGSFSGDVTANGSTATVSLTPTIVTINPTSTGNINNMNIGASTRGSGAFTSLAANAAVAFTANTSSSTTGTGSLVVTGGVGVSGQVTATSVSATNLTGTIQTAAQPNITSTGGLSVPSLAIGTSSASFATIDTYTQRGIEIVGTKEDGTAPVIRLRETGSGSGAFEIRSNRQGATSGNYLAFGEGTSTFVVVRGDDDGGSTTTRGFVGIGTTSPTTNLQIVGSRDFDSMTSINVTNGSNDYGRAQIRITGRIQGGNDGWALGGRANLIFAANAATSGATPGVVGNDKFALQYNMLSDMLGFVSVTTNTTPILSMTQTGSVGIGTTDFSAGYTFNVAKRARFNGMMLGNSDGSNTADNRILFDWSSGVEALIIAQQNVPLRLGVAGSAKVSIDSGGHFLPVANDTQNLGSASLAWANIYTNDLHLNNETKVNGNDVDGTTGNWTIQEGAENLYIINNKTGKKFAFVLKELE